MLFINTKLHRRKSETELHMDFLPNFQYHGYRLRLFGGKWFYRPPKETFAEFLENFIKFLFSEDWGKEQAKKQREHQHIVYRWATDCHAAKSAGCPDQRVEEDGSVSFIPSGPILSWLSFGYDLLCLYHKRILQKKLIKRLKDHNEFQGAWFEVAVAAALLRAGCDIKWINDMSKRNCELIATHRATNIQFGVEAKSRRRHNVLNHTGIVGSTKTSCGGLVQSGLGQAPISMPFVLFIDTNIPSTPNIPLMEKPMLNETKVIIDCLHEASVLNPDKFSLLIVTSFGFHYGDIDKPASFHENCNVLPQHTKHPLPMSVLNDINASIKRYGLIPEEV